MVAAILLSALAVVLGISFGCIALAWFCDDAASAAGCIEEGQRW